MTLIPTAGQMLTVIGVALLITVVLVAVIGYLAGRLDHSIPAHPGQAGLHDDRIPAATPALPGQRPATHEGATHEGQRSPVGVS